MSTPRRKATDAARWKRRIESETPEQREFRLAARRTYMASRAEEANRKQNEYRKANPEKAKQYYQNRKVKFTEEDRRERRIYRAKQFAEKRAYVRQLKEDKPCIDCGGYFPPYCMDLHHKNPAEKRWEVSWAIYKTISLKEIVKEAAKCELVCANCHRIRSYNEHHERRH